jgi:4-amino-4-deoxychorismate lyase
MSRLIETIRIENGQLKHIDLHNNRFNKARKALFGITTNVQLEHHIQIPESISPERHKCRISTDGISIHTEITPYQQREIKTLNMVHFDTIEYQYKTDKRQLLDAAFLMRNNCDDIIIIKNNMITDSWAANIILFDGDRWLTPDTPLLKGIQREYLLSIGFLIEKKIQYTDIMNFKYIKLINALIDFERAPSINCANSIYHNLHNL